MVLIFRPVLFIHRLFTVLTFLCVIQLIHSQGGGGDDDDDYGGFGDDDSDYDDFDNNYIGYKSNSPSRVNEEWVFVYIVFIGIIAGIFYFVDVTRLKTYLSECAHFYYLKARALLFKPKTVQLKSILRTETTNIFQTGTYYMRYYQYSKWHGPYLAKLVFKNKRVTGDGNDDVGSFTAEGNYSKKTNRLTLKKQYQLGTGNPKQNLGHQVSIELQWNDNEQRFNGKWSVKTATYSGNDKFELYLR